MVCDAIVYDVMVYDVMVFNFVLTKLHHLLQSLEYCALLNIVKNTTVLRHCCNHFTTIGKRNVNYELWNGTKVL